MSIDIQLRKPIKHGDEEISTITLREPSVEDIENLGFPFKIDEEMRPTPIPSVCSKFISKLSALPPSVVRQMHQRDFWEASMAVVYFFRG